MRVLIIDDDPIVCSSLETILSAQPDVDVVGTGHDGAEAVRLHARLRPDVLLMDVQMPGTDGLDAAERILGRDPGARIVFLTTFSDDAYVSRALRLGTHGYLIKQDVAAIAPALRAIMAGQRVLEGKVLDKVAGSGGMARDADESALAPLTEREREVVRLVADGLDNAQVAAALCLSEGTVRNHISSVLAKLDLRNRTQIAVFYLRRCR